LNRVLDQPKIL